MNNRKFRNWLKRKRPEFQVGDSSSCQECLNGMASHGAALFWHQSPQGLMFWHKKGERPKFSKRTRQFLAKLRDEARRRGC